MPFDGQSCLPCGYVPQSDARAVASALVGRIDLIPRRQRLAVRRESQRKDTREMLQGCPGLELLRLPGRGFLSIRDTRSRHGEQRPEYVDQPRMPYQGKPLFRRRTWL